MKKLLVAGIALAASLPVMHAWAGSKTTATVYVSTASMYAQGSLGSARGSTDTMQYIGCYAEAYSSGSQGISCYARDAAGTYVSCRSSQPEFVNLAASLNEGHLLFYYDASGNCTFLRVNHGSHYAPEL